MKENIRAKLLGLCRRLEELDAMLAAPDAADDMKRFTELSRERAEIEPVVLKTKEYEQTLEDIATAEEMAKDPEVAEFAREEMLAGKKKLEELEQDLQILLLPRDPDDNKNTFLEIRAGTGGEESALFAGDLLRMYMRYAERSGWRVEIVSKSDSDLGGYREVICRIIGEGAYSRLKFESGGHRVQRVPETEAQGRVHTSACTVAVMPEADEVEAVKINPQDLRIDVYRASGAGGQQDFVLGAYLSNGGKSFICLSSTFKKKDGTLASRIRPTLVEGSIVTDTRVNTMYVVTEYGCVNLKGLSSWERAEALISIAHPDFREELIQAAQKQKIWYHSNKR